MADQPNDPVVPEIVTRAMTLVEALEGKEIVSITNDAIVAVQKPIQLAAPAQYANDDRPEMRERGSLGYANWYSGPSDGVGIGGSWGRTSYNRFLREEYNPELRGLKGLLKYDEMRKSDAQVRATLRLVKTPVLAARWYMEPGGETKKDKTIAEFVWNNLTKWMSQSWPQLLTEILVMLDFGFYNFEKVFDVISGGTNDGKVYWRKFAPRHPMDVFLWDYDEYGGPKGAWFYAPSEDPNGVYIPIKKLAIFTFDKEAGNLEGVSVLRSAYKHWYLKDNLYKIDAIQKERHGIGIPIINLPANFSSSDRALAEEMGRNLRTNEKAHVVLPPNWTIEWAHINGTTVDAIASAEHHDLQIARNILGQFINATREGSQGEQQELFLKATRFIADIIRDVFNKYCIPQLVKYNWGERDEYPELKARRIGDTVDWRTISFAIRNFIGAGVLVPDAELEKWVRDEMDLPAKDPDTARTVVSPQQAGVGSGGQPNAGAGNSSGAPASGQPQPPNAGRTGPPRQSTAAGNQQANNAGGSRTGQDRSGG